MELPSETKVNINFVGRIEPWTIGELLEEYPTFTFETLVEDIFDTIEGVESVEILGYVYPKN